MKKFALNLKRQAQENPIVTIVIALAVVSTTATIAEQIGHARGSHAYAKQVNYRIKNEK